MKRTLWRALLVVSLMSSFLAVMPAAASVPAPDAAPAAAPTETASTVAKLPPIAIGAIPTTGMHLRAPRADVVERQLRKIGAIPNDAFPDQVQAALEAYYARFAKKSADWVSPKIQEWARKREAELAQPRVGALAIQPVTATILSMAVDFGKTETFTLPLDDGTGECVTQTVTITGPLKGNVPPPGAKDNNTIWYSPTLTSDAKFYEKLMFGYEGAGRTRFDLTDPDDGQPGINLAGRTMQDYYDNVASPGNVYITGTVVGWVTVPHSEGYYGAPNCASGNSDGGIVPVGQLVVDAIKVFSTTHSSYYTDTSASAFWKQFDRNHDGMVDQFALVHAGIGQEAGGGEQGDFAIWSHSSSLFAAGYWDGFKVYEGDPSTTADDIYVSNYTMQPESLDLGVLVEEFGHNFFGWPDLYTSDYEDSIGFWNEMAGGSWLGWVGGSAPAGMPLWFRMIASCGTDAGGNPIPCNWQEPMVTRAYTDTLADITIGQLEKTPAGVNKGVRINMPSTTETINNEAGTGKCAYTDQGLDNANLYLDRQIAVGSTATGTLTISSTWYIEEGYDYGFVLVNGRTVKDLNGNMVQYSSTDWGLTGRGSGVLNFDLSAYKGTTVTLRLNYRTDAGYTDPGWWVDDVKLDGQLIDNFETATAPHTFPGWTNSSPGWTVAPTTRTLEKYYLAEWRSKTKYDQMVKTAYQTVHNTVDEWQVTRIPHNLPGALVYYRDQGYKATYALSPNIYQPPSIGPKYQLLIVDMHPEPDRFGVFDGTVYRISRRNASYDAALTLQPTERITVTIPDTSYYPFTTTVVLPAKPAVTKFSDAKGYYAGLYAGSPCAAGRVCFANTESSVVVPARGPYSTKITHYDGSPYPELYGSTVRGGGNTFTLGTGNPGDANVQYGVNVQLLSKAGDDAYNSRATLRFQNLVIKKDVGPAPANITAPGVYTFTYWVALTNQSSATVSGTITMTLPAGLNFVSGGPPGATASVDRQFVWSGYPLPASTPITFTLVATTEVKAGDPVKVWTASADVDDGVNPVTHDTWTTNASLFTTPGERPATGDSSSKSATPGSTVLYRVTVTNTSLYNSDTFTVTATTNPTAWTTYLLPVQASLLEATAAPIVIGPIAPSATADVFVLVTIPSTAAWGAKATTTLSATSVGDPVKTSSLTLTTFALFKVYLPVVMK